MGSGTSRRQKTSVEFTHNPIYGEIIIVLGGREGKEVFVLHVTAVSTGSEPWGFAALQNMILHTDSEDLYTLQLSKDQ